MPFNLWFSFKWLQYKKYINNGIFLCSKNNHITKQLINEIRYLSLIMIGVFGVIGQIGLTVSYQLSKASYVAPYSYFYIIFTGLIGFVIWNEIPDILSIIGYLFIIVSYYYLIRFVKLSYMMQNYFLEKYHKDHF